MRLSRLLALGAKYARDVEVVTGRNGSRRLARRVVRRNVRRRVTGPLADRMWGSR